MKTATARKPAVQPLTITLPTLAKGEIYAGICLADGKPSHHLITLPGKFKGPWQKAIDWAKKQGGELPTRQEQSLQFANSKEHFESAWYWSSEPNASYESYAWMQVFNNGYQNYDRKANDYRARAVRRITI